jgi:hypothetical protein
MRRRDFLQGIGLTTIFWGLGQHHSTATASLLAKLANNWQSAPTAQKFALLVGVNHYSQAQIPDLAGCVTDLEMQSQLLRYRYGFAEENIFKLADQEATGDNLRSTQAELTKRIQAGDLLVGHFSGYGTEEMGNHGLVLFDEILPLTIWGDWLRSLPTNYLTTILDTSFTPAPTSSPTNLQSRSLPSSIAQAITQSTSALPASPILTPASTSPSTPASTLGSTPVAVSLLSPDSNPAATPSLIASPNPESIPTQDKAPILIPKSSAPSLLNSPPRLLDITPALPGIVVRAAIDQPAMEKAWDGFSAGLFTYAFTQTLWQGTNQENPPNLQGNLDRARKNLEAAIPGSEDPQTPNFIGKSPSPFLVPQELNSPAAGLMTEKEGNNEAATLWLGGLPSQVLAHYGVESLLKVSSEISGADPRLDGLDGLGKAEGIESPVNSAINSPANSSLDTLLQVVDRTGLTAKVKIVSAINPSSPNAPPTNIPEIGNLVQELVRVLPRHLTLEVLLDRHLSRIERVDATSTFAGIRHVSLGKTSGDYLFTVQNQSYALSTLRGDLLPDTKGQTGEAVKSAVGRLKGQLSSLLALKLLYLTDHQSPELLGLQLNNTRIMNTGNHDQSSQDSPSRVVPRQYLLENTSDRPLWGMIFSHTPDPQLWLLPSLNPSPETIPRFGIYELPPQTKVSIDLPAKFTTAYGIFSSQPLKQTIATLAELHPELTTAAPIPPKVKLSNPLKVMETLYQDLQAPEATLDKFPVAFNASDNYIFDINTWATFLL